MIKIAIIDDHDLFREGLKLVLQQIEGFEVIFENSSGILFLEFLEHTIPDVVLMDINMPVIDGIETTQKAIACFPDLKVIALTMFSDTTNYIQMIGAGVKGFVLKKSNKFELQQAISNVFEGSNYFSQEILQKLSFQSAHSLKGNENITNREMEILQLICKGLTTQEISEKLFISFNTVETHRTNIFRKSNVKNIAGLIVWAIKNNHFSIE
ncbi:MAG: response regulator transcription factor [Bacteroidetes bacterium]|nr:response regulator transcription factor [Bacteroidota bacterium]